MNELASMFAKFGAWLLVGVICIILLDGLTLFWGAKTCSVPESTLGKGILSSLTGLIAAFFLSFVPSPFGSILILLSQWLLVMGIFGTSFGKGIAVWLLGILYILLLFVPIGIVAALVIGVVSSS